MSVIDQMLQKYGALEGEDTTHALREIMQEVALAGLQRAGFFDKAAFYGGTCLRIFQNKTLIDNIKAVLDERHIKYEVKASRGTRIAMSARVARRVSVSWKSPVATPASRIPSSSSS